MITHEDALLPILQVLAAGGVMDRRPLIEATANHMGVHEDDREVVLASGQAQFRNRIGWAMSFLKKAGLLTQPRRGQYEIAAAGQQVVDSGTDRIDAAWLRENSDSFVAWVEECRTGQRRRAEERREGTRGDATASTTGELTPEDALQQAHATLQADLAEEILDTIKERDPAFFERLVVRLLVKMGYGGSFEDAARSVGKAGDGGIDGIIKEDRLGLDAIYIQAKRYQDQNSVGRPAVQAFVGAITGHRANKGVFLTTSTFTREASEYVTNLDKTVVLIDGDRLAELMIEFNLGVNVEQTYEIKRIDSDFFEE
jgi:restriction system protein